jgi:3-deoxy-7-phosphoheptulonate synthase
MVDCSHANSRKQHQLQIEVGKDVSEQVAAGNHQIIGTMIESHLNAGRQDVKPGVTPEFGTSITDACINWDDTADLLRVFAEGVRKRREK